jgi:alpha-glucosidase
MQWDAAGGFSRAEPWLPYGDLRLNVADQREDPDSLLSLYRRLLALRPALALEGYETVRADDVLAFHRGPFTVALNLGAEEAAIDVRGTVVAATAVADEGRALRGETRLRAGEGLAIRRELGE